MSKLPENLARALLAYSDPLAVFTWQGDDADLVAKVDDLALARRHLTPEQKLELDRKLADLGFTQLERAEMIGCTQGRVSQLGSISNIKTNIAYIPDFRVKVTPEMRQQIAARVATGGAGRPGRASPGAPGHLRAARLVSGASGVHAGGGAVSRAERIGWLLGLIICLVIPLLFGHWREAIAGTGALAVLWWLLRRDRLL